MSRHLRHFVTQEFPFEISRDNRAYYPLDKDIVDRIQSLKTKFGPEKDLLDIAKFIDEWKKTEPTAHFYYRPSTKNEDKRPAFSSYATKMNSIGTF